MPPHASQGKEEMDRSEVSVPVKNLDEYMKKLYRSFRKSPGFLDMVKLLHVLLFFKTWDR